MPIGQLSDIIRQIRPSVLQDVANLTDGELLDRFTQHCDSRALDVLIRRHGQMVWSICSRVLQSHHDAEDAFQATFVVLVRKAAAIRPSNRIAGWLYGVARKTALYARTTSFKRKVRERQVEQMPESQTNEVELNRECLTILDAELALLPEKYRTAIVLCELEGKTRKQAARECGVPEGTMSGWLTRGKAMLARRLTRQGISFSAATALFAEDIATGEVSQSVVSATIQSASGVIPDKVAQLMEGVLKTMLMKKLKITVLVLGLVMTLTAGAAVILNAADPPQAKTNSPETLKQAGQAAVANTPPSTELNTTDPADGFTSRPLLRGAVDLDFWQTRELAWSHDGSRLAIRGYSIRPLKDGKEGVETHDRLMIVSDTTSKDPTHIDFYLPQTTALLGFTPDGKSIVTELREYDLLSGYHRLNFWEVGQTKPQGMLPLSRTKDLDPDPTRGYAFSGDGRSFRTVRPKSGTNFAFAELEVLEVSAETRKTPKAILTIKGEITTYNLGAAGKRLAVMEGKDLITVWDVDRVKKLWTTPVKFDPRPPKPVPSAPPHIPGNAPALPVPESAGKPQIPMGPMGAPAPFAPSPQQKQDSGQYHGATLALSPDGSRILCARGIGCPIVLDGLTGKILPDLEEADSMYVGGPLAQRITAAETVLVDADSLGSARHYFTREGRFLALSGKQFVKRTATSLGSPVDFLSVWDTRTGKLLKWWDQQVNYAVCPTRPVLAIVEKNRTEGVRLGFWDFSVEK